MASKFNRQLKNSDALTIFVLFLPVYCLFLILFPSKTAVFHLFTFKVHDIILKVTYSYISTLVFTSLTTYCFSFINSNDKKVTYPKRDMILRAPTKILGALREEKTRGYALGKKRGGMTINIEMCTKTEQKQHRLFTR